MMRLQGFYTDPNKQRLAYRQCPVVSCHRYERFIDPSRPRDSTVRQAMCRLRGTNQNHRVEVHKVRGIPRLETLFRIFPALGALGCHRNVDCFGRIHVCVTDCAYASSILELSSPHVFNDEARFIVANAGDRPGVVEQVSVSFRSRTRVESLTIFIPNTRSRPNRWISSNLVSSAHIRSR